MRNLYTKFELFAAFCFKLRAWTGQTDKTDRQSAMYNAAFRREGFTIGGDYNH